MHRARVKERGMHKLKVRVEVRAPYPANWRQTGSTPRDLSGLGVRAWDLSAGRADGCEHVLKQFEFGAAAAHSGSDMLTSAYVVQQLQDSEEYSDGALLHTSGMPRPIELEPAEHPHLFQQLAAVWGRGSSDCEDEEAVKRELLPALEGCGGFYDVPLPSLGGHRVRDFFTYRKADGVEIRPQPVSGWVSSRREVTNAPMMFAGGPTPTSIKTFEWEFIIPARRDACLAVMNRDFAELSRGMRQEAAAAAQTGMEPAAARLARRQRQLAEVAARMQTMSIADLKTAITTMTEGESLSEALGIEPVS